MFFPVNIFIHYILNINLWKDNAKIQILNTEKISEQVLCMPIIGDLNQDDVVKICKLLLNIKNYN